jgi:hypothetical protein
MPGLGQVSCRFVNQGSKGGIILTDRRRGFRL